MRAIHAKRIVGDFLQKARSAEPSNEVWQGEDDEVMEKMGLLVMAEKLVDHHRQLLMLFSGMYRDVKYKLGESVNDLSLFRSKPYLERIDAQMQGFLDWVSPPQLKKEVESSSSQKKGGFGGGGKGGGAKPKSSKGFGKR